MGLQIVEANTHRLKKAFVRFPMELYKDCEFYVPPLIREELEIFNPKKNPAFEIAKVRLFLAMEGSKVVGRIAGIVSSTANTKQRKEEVRFGWFDSVNDQAVATALFNAVAEFGREHGMEHMTGPEGFSHFDKEGMLVEGFDKVPTFVTYYNFPYYIELAEGYGLRKEVDFIEFLVEATAFDQDLPGHIARLVKRVKDHGRFRALEFSNARELRKRMEQIFAVMEEAYSDLYDMVPFSTKQRDYYIKKFSLILNKDLLKVVVDANDDVVGFAWAMPSLSKALQKAKGRLFPFGIFHLIKAFRTFDTLDFCLIGVRKAYRHRGIDLLLVSEMHKTAQRLGIQRGESNPQLETNGLIHAEMAPFSPTQHKRRRIYSKPIVAQSILDKDKTCGAKCDAEADSTQRAAM
ncbi:MAG: hypothetical protein GWP08_00345 [Nitrospiraceae bacterium]|nr:hypothetical protein [Nitrospiraceae bacterium]